MTNKFADPEIGARVFLNTKELRLLQRLFNSGRVGGMVETRKSIEGKVVRALKAIHDQEAETIENGEVKQDRAARVPSRALLPVAGGFA